MRHKVKMKDLIDWKKDAKVLFASSIGRGIDKKLYCNCNGFYEVWNKGKRVHLSQDSELATTVYNSI